jgi:hypothetical protein
MSTNNPLTSPILNADASAFADISASRLGQALSLHITVSRKAFVIPAISPINMRLGCLEHGLPLHEA